MSYEDIVAAYADVRPRYERLAELMQEQLRSALAAQGHHLVEVSGRAKEIDSYGKKAIRKGHADPLREIGDKAGVRLVIPFASERERIEGIAAHVLALRDRDDKGAELGAARLGYLGIHYVARLREVPQGAEDLSELVAELQIHTKVENAWAVAGHDLLYKATIPVPDAVSRRLMRLVSLVELFDEQVTRFQEELRAQPGYAEMRVYPLLERQLLRLTARKPDPALSVLVIPRLARLYDRDIVEAYKDCIEPFLEENWHALTELYSQYENDPAANPLLHQPEALLIFERGATDRFQLNEGWPSEIPREYLHRLLMLRGIAMG